jgi:hypothetical protein
LAAALIDSGKSLLCWLYHPIGWAWVHPARVSKTHEQTTKKNIATRKTHRSVRPPNAEGKWLSG